MTDDLAGLREPEQCRDRSEDWLALWHEKRRAQIRDLVSPELIAAHRADPVGGRVPHGPDLQQVLNYVRSSEVLGKAFILAERPFESYLIGRISPRGVPVDVDRSQSYATEEEAAHAVFVARLAALGVDPAIIEEGLR